MVYFLYFINFIIDKVIYLVYGLWISLFVCQLKGHDWRFIGGGWIFCSTKSFECKRCFKKTDDPN